MKLVAGFVCEKASEFSQRQSKDVRIREVLINTEKSSGKIHSVFLRIFFFLM